MAKKATAKKKAAPVKRGHDFRPIAIVGFGLLIAAVISSILDYMSIADKSVIEPMQYFGFICLVVGGALASLALFSARKS